MRPGWETKSLGDVCALINRGIAPKYVETGGVAVLNQKCVRDHRIAFDLGRRHDVAAKKVDPERFIRVGDVLVNSTGTGTLGRVAQIRSEPPEPATVDTHVTIVRPQAGRFYPDFFGYMIIQIEDEIARSGEGASGQTELARSTLQNKFAVSFPVALSEQQRIVAILDEAFAGLATATANAEKNLKNAQELFDGVSKSLLSARNEKWEHLSLETLLEREWIVSHLDGNHGNDYPRKEEFVSSGVPYLSANCLDEDSVDMSRAKFLSSERAASLRKGIAKNNDVLFAHNATVGPVAMLYTDEPKVILSTSLTYYRCDHSYIVSEYLAHYMRSPEFKNQYEAVMRQSTRNQVPITKQRELFHVIPPLDEQRQIATKLDALRDEVKRLDAVYRKRLADVRDLKQSILKKAFAGELTSPPSQAIKEAAE